MHKDGTIYLLIGSTTYVYGMDAAKHPHIRDLMKYTPGKALHYIQRNATWTKKGDTMTPAEQAVARHEPFIHVYESVGGWKPQVRVWEDAPGMGEEGGFWDVSEVGLIGHPTKEAAVREGKEWAECEGLPFHE